MTEFPCAHRRGVLRGMLASVLIPAHAIAASDPPRDQGIGGTGMAAAPPNDEDRGIGGTGVIGTIRRFGSIYVNGLRVAYPDDVRITVDGRAASLDDLRLGHVVAVNASGSRGKLATHEIAVSREVVGPVGLVEGKTLSVLGQTVRIDGAMPNVGPGDWIAISGLRRADGSIAASLIEPTSPGVARIAGPLISQGDGVAVGGLALSGIGASLVGQRVIVEGSLRGNAFTPASIVGDTAISGLGTVRNVSIEGYVTRENGGLRFGSGLTVDGSVGRSADGHAVVSARVSPSGELRAERIAPASSGALDRSGPQRAPAGERSGLGGGGGRPGGTSPGGNGPGGTSPGGTGPGGNGPRSGSAAPSTPGRDTPMPMPGSHSAAPARGGGGTGPAFGQPGGGFGSPGVGGRGPGGFGGGGFGGGGRR